MKENCEFHCFKESGKWYASARGFISREAFSMHGLKRKAQIIKDNYGKWPGLSTEGDGLYCIYDPDEDLDFGYPGLLHAKTELRTNEQILKYLLTTEEKLDNIAGVLLVRILAALDDIRVHRDGNRQSLLFRVGKMLDPEP